MSGDTAEEVWNLCNAKLQEDSMSVRNIIKQSNVKVIGTTDDPADTLEWHKKLADDPTFDVKVVPSWRPDKSININKPDFLDYMKTLSEASGIAIDSVAALKEALRKRMTAFDELGCRASDHGIDYVMYAPADDAAIEAIFAKRAEGNELTEEEIAQYKTNILLFLAKRIPSSGMGNAASLQL